MKKIKTFGVAAMFAMSLGSIDTHAQGDRGIYGNDDRKDYFQASESYRKLADSTVALFKTASVSASGGLTVENFGKKLQLCSDEPFREQPMGAFCSGSLVAPDLVMTAGHCVKSENDCSETKMVFGFAVKQEGQYPDRVEPSEVYSCKSIVARNQELGGTDYAIIRLNRPVLNHAVLEINRSGNIRQGARLVVIGHPVGLPVKVAGGASVRRVSSSGGYFVANLDTYGGNSGSAVFNEETGLIEGILVRGGTDFEVRQTLFGKCRASVRVSDDGGRGEDVTNVSVVSGYIPRRDGLSVPVEVPVTPTVTDGDKCVDPGQGASVDQLLAYIQCLTNAIQNAH